jgi:hypothetical protein
MTVPRELAHFLLLSRAEQAGAIRRLATLGWSDFTISAATRLSVEQVRRILAGSLDPAPSNGHAILDPHLDPGFDRSSRRHQ